MYKYIWFLPCMKIVIPILIIKYTEQKKLAYESIAISIF
jgi:hypothetical protein